MSSVNRFEIMRNRFKSKEKYSRTNSMWFFLVNHAVRTSLNFNSSNRLHFIEDELIENRNSHQSLLNDSEVFFSSSFSSWWYTRTSNYKRDTIYFDRCCSHRGDVSHEIIRDMNTKINALNDFPNIENKTVKEEEEEEQTQQPHCCIYFQFLLSMHRIFIFLFLFQMGNSTE